MAILTVKNRYASQPFVGMFDGQDYTVADTLVLPDYVARHLRKQSVATDNPITGERTYRLAVIEDGDDDSPLEALPLESLDRTDMDLRKVVLVPSRLKAPPPTPRSTFGALEVGSKTQ